MRVCLRRGRSVGVPHAAQCRTGAYLASAGPGRGRGPIREDTALIKILLPPCMQVWLTSTGAVHAHDANERKRN